MKIIPGLVVAVLATATGATCARAAVSPPSATLSLFHSVELHGVDPATRHGQHMLKRRLAVLVRQSCARVSDEPTFVLFYGPGKIPSTAPETARAKCVRRGTREATAYRKALATSRAGVVQGS